MSDNSVSDKINKLKQTIRKKPTIKSLLSEINISIGQVELLDPKIKMIIIIKINPPDRF